MPLSFDRKDYPYEYRQNRSNTYPIEQEDFQKKEDFLSIVKQCVENDIAFYIVFPPNFQEHSYAFEKRLRDLASGGVQFIVHDTTNEIYQDKAFFYDHNHLKVNGAKIFTKEVIEVLKQGQALRNLDKP